MEGRSVLIGAAAGSALMFVLDPAGGRRRRALVRDKMIKATRKTRDGLDAAARDLAKRTGGIAAEARAIWASDTVDDATLAARVRAQLGRECSHPAAITVDARGGEVTLRGQVLAREVDDILAAVTSVRGVQKVIDELEAHETADNTPSLQGRGRVPGAPMDVMQRNWAPATRAIVSAGLVATGVWAAVRATRASREGDRHVAL